MTDNAKNYHEKMFPGYVSDFLRTDPEFIEAFDNFAFDEVVNQDDIDDKTRFISILAVLLGCQGIDEFKGMLKAAYNFGVTPVEMKEIVYQAVAYLGIGRVFPFLKAANCFIEDTLGLKLPLENQNDPNTNRLEKGEQAQVAIFGEEMRGYATSGDPKTVHIRKWLTDKTDRCNASAEKSQIMKPVTSKYKASTIAYKMPFAEFPKDCWITFRIHIDWTVYGKEAETIVKPGMLDVQMSYTEKGKQVNRPIVDNEEILIGRNDEDGYYFKFGIYRVGNSTIPVCYNLAGYSEN